MQAWLLPAFTGIQNLQLAELPEPAAGPGEVLLRVHFAALNPADRYLAEGQYPARPPLPHILGRDGIGMVTEVGPGVHGILTGEKYAILRGEVGVSRPGTFAQRVAVPAESLISPPPLWTDEEAAGATLVYLTAYQALTQWGALPPGVLLITGASGGVGTASLQLGKALGHTVAALSRSANKRSRLTQLGADVVLDPADP
ncbi:MAG TPA: alcohol dehydrogenase catalytic domain-containing protein, partial [Tepidisphaeraceae bacterium]